MGTHLNNDMIYSAIYVDKMVCLTLIMHACGLTKITFWKDICQADSKSFSSQWTLLLPTNDVLQPRKFEATLMTCLLFDPYLKARVASASTLEAMLDGPSSVFLLVAEFKESSKRGSFTALSSSLGQILMQLHTGILYLVQRQTHSRLLASLFKILMLLISSTPNLFSNRSIFIVNVFFFLFSMSHVCLFVCLIFSCCP
ncbi:uncharacterized protein LOC133741867 [Rosa rugosa]|uniref:uncharacterized protein LOC133741867 n=1 Tax=Rosa rugosa TaxID=74645 RepID=UPI002B416D1C|nr:uncharacterized protein LOC133741867 [Rosa rugosa]